MKLFREGECFHHSLHRIGTFLFGTAEQKRVVEQQDKQYFADKLAREKFAEHARQAAEQRDREREAAEAKKERAQEAAEAKLEKARAAKQRRLARGRVEKAKQFVKAKKLRRVQRNGRTVYVNQSNDIVNYAILAYLLSSNSHESSSSYEPSYSHSSSSSDDSSSWSSGGSDFGGSFGGGDSGGGGASGSW